MKQWLTGLGAISLIGVATLAQSAEVAQTAVTRAGAVIDAVAEAYGGAEALANLESIIQKSQTQTLAVNQSLRPDPPWDQGHNSTFNAIDLAGQRFVTRNQGEGGGFVFDGGTIINGDDSFQVNYRAKTATPIAQPDFDTAAGPFIRVTGLLLARQLLDRRQMTLWLGEESIDGRSHDVLGLVMAAGPALSLYIDQDSRLINRAVRVLPPFGEVGYRFSDYQRIDGYMVNQAFELTINDDRNLTIEIESTRINQPLDDYLSVAADLQRQQPLQPDPLSVQQLADGVYLAGGAGTYALFVEMDDHIIAVGGTAGIPDRIAAVREQLGDKPIRYGVLTHHHNDHLLGVAAYAAEQATIVTVPEHEAIVRRTAGDADVDLMLVQGRHVFDDGQRRLELHDIGPTPHSEHLLVAYLPAEGILFEADHFPQPRVGPLPPPNPVTLALIEAVKSKGLAVKQVVGAHSPRISTGAEMMALGKGR
ncbi:MAG: MBL fold metallo-hydrolase [Wenzhouxiangellaceae bacterium]